MMYTVHDMYYNTVVKCKMKKIKLISFRNNTNNVQLYNNTQTTLKV
jgi:hypothetical protein